MDSYGKKAGKGALINENMAMTLGVSQDQTLFVPRGGGRDKPIVSAMDKYMI